MLVEVIDEQPSTRAAQSTHEEHVLRHLVSHYNQPIHIPSPGSSPYFAATETLESGSTLPAVLQFCLEQIRQLHRNDMQQCCLGETMGNFLSLYTSLVRPTLFDGPRTARATGIAVLYFFEWLLSLLARVGDSREANELSPSLLDSSTEACSKSLQHWKDGVAETLQTLLRDLTKSVEQISGTPDSTETNNQTSLWRTYVIPSILRLMHKCLLSHPSLLDQQPDVARQCAVRLLAWTTPLIQPSIVAPDLADALSFKSLSTTPELYAPRHRVETWSLWKGLDWNTPMRLSSDHWCSPAACKAATGCFELLLKGSQTCHVGVDVEQLSYHACEKLGWGEMAMAVRQHFFGRNDFSSDPGVVAPLRTRLHLGRTVTEETVEHEKPYQAVPTRLYGFYVFVSLVDSVTTPMVDSLVPVLYELLSAPQEIVQSMGAVCLYNLLYKTGASKYVWSSLVLSNLVTALDLTIQTCRKGEVVCLLGATQALLLKLLTGEDAKILRRKASQQWLMIMHKNLQNPELVWGVLAGAVVRLGVAHVQSGEDNDGLELGRLALSCLLPLMRQDDGTGPMQMGGLGVELQWLALVALSHWLVAAHAVMVHHEDKLLGSLLVCMGRCSRDERSAIYIWARHVAAMVQVITTWDEGADSTESSSPGKLAHIAASGVYQKDFIEAIRQTQKEAQFLQERLVHHDDSANGTKVPPH